MVTMPVEQGFVVTSGFGRRGGQYAGMHWGTDFGVAGGSGGRPVFVVKDGTVTRAGAASGFGQWVTVDHPASNGGGETVYGHVIPEVSAGQQVREGQRIARINPDSRTNGGVAPHLHMEWHRYSWSPPGPDRLDPMAMLAGARWPGAAPVAAPPKGRPVAVNTSVPVDDWSPRFAFGDPRPASAITGICIHVTVNAPGTPASNVAQYQLNSQSGSYHELTDTAPSVLIENTDDWLVWAAGPTSNYRHLHRSFVMRGTEDEVMWRRFDAMLRAGAQRDAAWAARYGIPVVKITGADLRAGRKGFFGHWDTTQAWGETDHVDPGRGFPWDYYLSLVRAYQQGSTPPTAESAGFTVSEANRIIQETTRYLADFTKGFNGPISSDVKDVRQQLTGGRDAGQYPGWPQLDNRTVVDALAVIGERLQIPGFRDPHHGPRSAHGKQQITQKKEN